MWFLAETTLVLTKHLCRILQLSKIEYIRQNSIASTKDSDSIEVFTLGFVPFPEDGVLYNRGFVFFLNCSLHLLQVRGLKVLLYIVIY